MTNSSRSFMRLNSAHSGRSGIYNSDLKDVIERDLYLPNINLV